jgi:plasmid stabilization system protein ParE
VKVWLSPEAEVDLQATLDFIRERNPSASVALAIRVFDTLEKLAAGDIEGPQQQLTTGEFVRSWPVPPFRIYYQRGTGVLHVFRIYHHARRPIAK